MAIIHVTALKDLRRQLVAYDWQLSKALEVIEFSVKDGNYHNYCKLEEKETSLLAAVMRPFDHSDFQYSFPQAAGEVLKTIVIQRFDNAIKQAAKEARDEAQSVLDVLEDV